VRLRTSCCEKGFYETQKNKEGKESNGLYNMELSDLYFSQNNIEGQGVK
jgi:hypothetical protein